MAKPKKYPKKFRQKLEKVAEEREARDASGSKDRGIDDPKFDILKTFTHELLLAGSVDTMLTRLDTNEMDLPRINTTYFLKPAWRATYTECPPPWTTKGAP